MKKISTKTYISTFIVTMIIFIVASVFSTYFTNKKTEELKADEDRIAINILSLETQYDLLKDSSCATFDGSSLREQLDSLASKLHFMEGQVGVDNTEVFRLKRYYSLLEIKDYLLTKRMSEQCGFKTVLVLYFYSNENCNECRNQDYFLSAIQNKYPQVEVYDFDYNVDLMAVKTLITLHSIPKEPPVIDINGTIYGPFKNLDSIDTLINTLTASTTKATSTPSIKKTIHH